MSAQGDSDAVRRFLAEAPPDGARQARLLERRQRIARAVLADGAMRIEDIADRFGTSLMTAHRDLDDLVARGILQKSRGAASPAPAGTALPEGEIRAGRQTDEKAAIAAAAAALVEPGQAVFLDDSTTVARMVPHLAARAPLTVITNALPLMSALSGTRGITLLGLGGRYHAWCEAFLGRMTIAEIGGLRADTVFMSAAAITDGIAFHRSALMADTKRAMFGAAARRVLLADHAKFARRALHGMAALDEFDAIVVDAGAAPAVIEAPWARDVEVIVARPRGTAQPA